MFGSPYLSGNETQFWMTSGGARRRFGRRLVVVVRLVPPAALRGRVLRAAAGWTPPPWPAHRHAADAVAFRPAGSPRTSGCPSGPMTTTVPYTTGLPLYVTFPVTSVVPPHPASARSAAHGQRSDESGHSEITSPIAPGGHGSMIVRCRPRTGRTGPTRRPGRSCRRRCGTTTCGSRRTGSRRRSPGPGSTSGTGRPRPVLVRRGDRQGVGRSHVAGPDEAVEVRRAAEAQPHWRSGVGGRSPNTSVLLSPSVTDGEVDLHRPSRCRPPRAMTPVSWPTPSGGARQSDPLPAGDAEVVGQGDGRWCRW